MSLGFFATNHGQQTNLIVNIIDQGNQFIKADVYFDTPAIAQILANIRKIDEAFQQARETASKKDLFK